MMSSVIMKAYLRPTRSPMRPKTIAPKRPHREPDGERREPLQQRDRRVASPDRTSPERTVGEAAEDVEVVPLDDRAGRRGGDHAPDFPLAIEAGGMSDRPGDRRSVEECRLAEEAERREMLRRDSRTRAPNCAHSRTARTADSANCESAAELRTSACSDRLAIRAVRLCAPSAARVRLCARSLSRRRLFAPFGCTQDNNRRSHPDVAPSQAGPRGPSARRARSAPSRSRRAIAFS